VAWCKRVMYRSWMSDNLRWDALELRAAEHRRYPDCAAQLAEPDRHIWAHEGRGGWDRDK